MLSAHINKKKINPDICILSISVDQHFLSCLSLLRFLCFAFRIIYVCIDQSRFFYPMCTTIIIILISAEFWHSLIQLFFSLGYDEFFISIENVSCYFLTYCFVYKINFAFTSFVVFIWKQCCRLSFTDAM